MGAVFRFFRRLAQIFKRRDVCQDHCLMVVGQDHGMPRDVTDLQDHQPLVELLDPRRLNVVRVHLIEDDISWNQDPKQVVPGPRLGQAVSRSIHRHCVHIVAERVRLFYQ